MPRRVSLMPEPPVGFINRPKQTAEARRFVNGPQCVE